LVLFYVLAAGIVLSAVAVVLPPFGRNPLHSAMSLISSFFFLAAMYVTLSAHLVGALQIIVYAGAVMVLFTFVIMLLNLGPDDFGEPRIKGAKLMGLMLLFFIAGKIWTVFETASKEAKPVDLRLPEYKDFGGVEDVGKEIFTSQVLPFELVGVLLLVAVVGAVVLAKKRLDYVADAPPAADARLGHDHGAASTASASHGGGHP